MMARPILPDSIRKRVPIIIAAGLTFFFLILTMIRIELSDVSPLTRVEYLWMDYKFRQRGPQAPAKDVVLVGIDQKTLDKLGSARVFQRTHFARLVDKLSEAKPKVIGFDILYSDVDVSNPENDVAFAESIRRAGNVVLGIEILLHEQTGERSEETPMSDELMKLVIEKEVFPAERRSIGGTRQISEVIRGRNLKLALPELMDASASFGFVNFHRDIEGGLRYQPQFVEYGGHLYPSLDLQLMKYYFKSDSTTVDIQSGLFTQVQIGNYTLPTDKYGRYMLNFNGPTGTHETISMIDVLDGLVPPEKFRDKIIIIGSPAVGLFDVVTTPFDAVLPGMELHANVIDNIIQNRFLQRTPISKVIDLAFILFFGVILGMYLPRMDAKRALGYSLLLFLVFGVFNVLSFIMLSWVQSFVYPGLALASTSLSLIGWQYLTEERERNRTKKTFEHYMDQNVVAQVLSQGLAALKLGGDKREMSVLFSDIRGFTSFSEKMAPTEVVHFLNQYFDKMQGVIFYYQGVLDKLISDAVMCFWGHPIETKDHAVRATLCALEMIQAVEDLRPVLILPGGARFEIGIGVNTGSMVVGNMGSQTRFSYTVMGDNVNLGSRLESLNKYYGTRILISDATYEEVRHLVFCRQLDTIQVKGKTDAVTIYEPMGLKRLHHDRRNTDRRGALTFAKKVKKAYVIARYGERRRQDRRMGSDRLLMRPEMEEIAMMYEHALKLYRKADFEAADMAFDHVLSLSSNDGPSRLMKNRISKYRMEYAGAISNFDPVYKFDEK